MSRVPAGVVAAEISANEDAIGEEVEAGWFDIFTSKVKHKSKKPVWKTGIGLNSLRERRSFLISENE